MAQIIIAVIVAVVGSNGLWALLQSRLARKDTMEDKENDITKALKQLDQKLDKLNEKVDQNSATLARTHILRFDDELINKVRHSKEYFEQTLMDIDTYERFCKTHPDFKNSYAESAIGHIKKVFDLLKERGAFTEVAE